MKCTACVLLPAIAILLSAEAPSQASDAGATSAAIKRVEFAGIYWGQPEAELKRELARRGFEITLVMSDHDPDFEEEVQKTAEGRLNGTNIGDVRRTQIIEASHGSERVEVHLGAFPGGPRVTDAQYDDRSGEHRVLDAAKQKYSAAGLAYVGKEETGHFCLPEDRSRCDDDAYGFGPMMPYIWVSKDGLALSPGANGKATYDKLFQDAVKAKMGNRNLSL